jgi:hypothetical protein
MAKVAEAEAADAKRSRVAIFGARIWERLRPQLVPALAIGAAATVAAVWLVTRGDSAPYETDTPRSDQPKAATLDHDLEPPAKLPPAPVEAEDIEIVIDREIQRIDSLYATNVEELIAIAGEERATWAAPRQRAYDAELARLRSAVAAVPLAPRPTAADGDTFDAVEAAAAARETRERAWQRLVAYLQRAATGEMVAGVTP